MGWSFGVLSVVQQGGTNWRSPRGKKPSISAGFGGGGSNPSLSAIRSPLHTYQAPAGSGGLLRGLAAELDERDCASARHARCGLQFSRRTELVWLGAAVTQNRPRDGQVRQRLLDEQVERLQRRRCWKSTSGNMPILGRRRQRAVLEDKESGARDSQGRRSGNLVERTSAATHGNDEVAPLPAIRRSPRYSTERTRSIQSRGSTGDSLLRQTGEAQAGDVEFENFRCLIVCRPAKASDGQFGVDGKHSAEFGASLIEATEMRQRDDFHPHR